MKTNKKAISLIVLVITIIVLGILATTVIISLSETNIIQNAQDSVDKYNSTTLAQAIALEEAAYILENDGVKPTTFQLIDRIAEKEIITTEQKTEILQNNGKLKIGEETYEIDKSTILSITPTCKSEEAGYRLRFLIELLKETENIEYTEYGFIYVVTSKYTITEGTVEENFTFEGAEKYGVTWANINSNSSSFELTKSKNPNMYAYALAITGMTEAQVDYKVMVRGYVKYIKDGVEGIMYSDVADYCCSDLL